MSIYVIQIPKKCKCLNAFQLWNNESRNEAKILSYSFDILYIRVSIGIKLISEREHEFQLYETENFI